MTPTHRSLPLRHVVAGLGLAAMVAVVATVSRETGESGAPRSGAPVVTAVPEASPPAAAAPAPLVEAPAVRTVSGPGILPVPRADAPPLRIEPPAKPTPPPKPIRPRRLMPVAMVDTASFTAGAIRVRLPGVAILGAEETCRDHAGTSWPCGRRALAGVRAVVRGRAVECPLPEGVRQGSFVLDCRLGEADLAERLVASGWARALDGESALGEAERRAEARGLGLHTALAPATVDPFPDPIEPPPDRLTAPLGADEAAPPPTRP